jgi:hypothetical protein
LGVTEIGDLVGIGPDPLSASPAKVVGTGQPRPRTIIGTGAPYPAIVVSPPKRT